MEYFKVVLCESGNFHMNALTMYGYRLIAPCRTMIPELAIAHNLI